MDAVYEINDIGTCYKGVYNIIIIIDALKRRVKYFMHFAQCLTTIDGCTVANNYVVVVRPVIVESAMFTAMIYTSRHHLMAGFF